MYGFTAEEAMGQPFLELLRTELLEGTLEALLQRLASGEPARIRVRDARKDGTRVPALVDVTPLRDDSGEPTGFLAVARDMSREMAAEQALRESEERFRSVVSAMAEGVILRGTDGSIAACNASAERILGTTAEEMRGGTFARPGWPMIREDGSPLPAEEHPAIRTLRTGAPVLGAVNGLVRPGGATTWLSVNSEPLRHRPEDPPYAVVTTFTDITEAKRQRDLLERSQRQLALVLEGSNDGFWDLDLAARCYAFSPRCFEIVGERPRGVTDSARFWWGRLHPDDLAMVRNALDRHLRGETERIDAECRLRSAEGGWRWVRGLGMAVERDASGRPTRLAGTLRDNTARHEARDRLGAALRENEKLVAELREALLSVKTLRGLLPICAWCKKVRNDGGYWERIEAYVSKHSEAEFSHALCPECYAREYPGDPLPGPNGEAGGGI
jgi:PAS domain S-box-containing protein